MRVRAALILAALAPLALGAQGRLSKEDANRFQAKLVQIVEYGNKAPARSAAPRSVSMTDAEVNSYLKYLAADEIPTGIVDPALSALGGGRVSGRAMVDLDAVRKQK